MVTAKVNVWSQFVGALLWDDTIGVGSFEFDTSFIKTALDLSPLKMPLDELQKGNRIYSFPDLPKQTYHGLPGLLADSLPDKFGNELIDAWLARQGRTPESMNPLERLCYIGKRGMGALEYEPVIPSSDDSSNILEIDELVRLAKEAIAVKKGLNTNIKDKDGLLNIIKVGTSAGGARAKAIIAFNDKTKEIRSGQFEVSAGFAHWLIKLDGVTNEDLGDPKGYGRIEYAYYKMAVASGIEMSESKLMEEHGRAHFMTRRFDRLEGNEKLHMQTLCGIAHYDYNQPTTYSYEQAFQVMRDLRLEHTDAEQLFRRMVFNVLARNQDDHTKNISFLMDKEGKWKLSPAYDLSYAFDPTNIWLSQHQLSVNGKRKNIKLKDFLKIAKEISLKKGKAIVEEIESVIVSWPGFAKDAGMPAKQIESIQKLHLTQSALI
ncbi:MAG: type II toxin-antitoxin system HipA family toxin [Chitinophagaceae bacterium]